MQYVSVNEATQALEEGQLVYFETMEGRIKTATTIERDSVRSSGGQLYLLDDVKFLAVVFE